MDYVKRGYEKEQRREQKHPERDTQQRQQEEARRQSEKDRQRAEQERQQEAGRRQEEERRREETRRRQEEGRRREDARRKEDQTSGQSGRWSPKEASKDRNWWDVLGIARDATPDEVKAAYRQKMKLYHPDKVAGLASEFVQLAEQRSRELNAALDEAMREVQR
jgi:hypothetical protein